jgi:hypothetical protein
MNAWRVWALAAAGIVGAGGCTILLGENQDFHEVGTGGTGRGAGSTATTSSSRTTASTTTASSSAATGGAGGAATGSTSSSATTGTGGAGTGGDGGGGLTCAEVDGDIGCCDANGVLHYCSAAMMVLTSKTCATGTVCGWNATKGYYECVAPDGGADPNGMYPIACQ